ncbi:MAG: trypsin-like serine protease [Bacteroidetes bacterium]|nr:trypsin-like serine protease [Bacteroidota bacterium]
MKNSRSLLLIAGLSISAAVVSAYIFSRNFSGKTIIVQQENSYPATAVSGRSDLANVSFVEASAKSRQSVVFIKTEAEVNRRSSFWFFDFDPFGQIGKVSSTGSGVILTADGYIVTNNHVIANADKIEVVLNNKKRSYSAKVVGRAASSDLALLKIDASDLKPIELANSDNISIGDWVLAVGNPFNLTSTVTAGIVSAKGRNINIVDNNFPIESFIQTDAAINPGNSGGALVNIEGKLVGVNTAIASKTGSYVGYGFAIPSNIVMKIVNDLREYGQIQQAFDGLDVIDLTEQLSAESGGLEDGVYVTHVSSTHRTASSVKTGDVIIKLDGQTVNNKSEYDEFLALRRPGESVKFTVMRAGKSTEATIKMENMDGTFELKRRTVKSSDILGAEFEKVTKVEKELYKISDGIKVSNISNGKIRQMNLPEGFIFLSVNDVPSKDLDDFISQVEKLTGRVRIEGISPQGGRQFLSFYFY